MGLKLRGVMRCGACGKPRGLGTHVCNPGRRRRRRTRLQNPVTWECGTCHKQRGLAHTCSPVRGDFRARRRRQATADRQRKRKAARARQAARRRQAAADRRARAKARKAAARTRPPRPRPPAHDYHACTDGDCQKYGCVAYREGFEEGVGSAADAGSGDGE